MISNVNPYLALGVRPFINCCSVRTMHGGSLMLPQVREAMDAASRWFVNLDELMEAAGKRLAELTGAEWGIVTCGSAAAVALGTAACVAGNDPVKMLRLPFTEGMVNRVIIPSKQRFAYDQAVRMIGCHIVEIDTRADLDRALEEPVAMVVLLGKQEHLTSVRLEEIAAVVKPRGIPIMVDAASEHLERPSPWLVRGADLVIYSGGKFLRGPQTSGLLLGVQASGRGGVAQRLAAPGAGPADEGVEGGHHRRPGRARILVRRARQRCRAAEMVRRLRGHRRAGRADTGVRRRGHRARGRRPRAAVEDLWDRAQYPIDGLGLRQRVLDGEPRIMLDDNSATENAIAVDPFQLQPGEAEQVGDAIAAVARCRRGRADGRTAAGGRIRRRVGIARRFSAGRADPPARDRTARRRACRPSAIGAVRGAGPAAGSTAISCNFRSLHATRASTISYLFEGEVRDGG